MIMRCFENIENPNNFRESDTVVFRVAPSTRYNINVVSDQRTPSHLLAHPIGRGCATEFERGSV